MREDDIKILQKYKEAPKILIELLADLDENKLDLSRAEGKWTIREIVHHIVECDLNYFQINRYALANTGENYVFNTFDAHVWNQSMLHNQRNITIELQLFNTIREYIAYLCEIIPDSFDRILVFQDGKATVRDALNHDINHSYQHIEQIKETIRLHSL